MNTKQRIEEISSAATPPSWPVLEERMIEIVENRTATQTSDLDRFSVDELIAFQGFADPIKSAAVEVYLLTSKFAHRVAEMRHLMERLAAEKEILKSFQTRLTECSKRRDSLLEKTGDRFQAEINAIEDEVNASTRALHSSRGGISDRSRANLKAALQQLKKDGCYNGPYTAEGMRSYIAELNYKSRCLQEELSQVPGLDASETRELSESGSKIRGVQSDMQKCQDQIDELQRSIVDPSELIRVSLMEAWSIFAQAGLHTTSGAESPPEHPAETSISQPV